MNEIILTTNSNLKQLIVDALTEYSDNLPKHPLPTIEGANKKLHSIRELADFLQISITTAMAYKNQGLPVIQFGRKVIFDTEEVLSWLSSKSRKNGRK